MVFVGSSRSVGDCQVVVSCSVEDMASQSSMVCQVFDLEMDSLVSSAGVNMLADLLSTLQEMAAADHLTMDPSCLAGVWLAVCCSVWRWSCGSDW